MAWFRKKPVVIEAFKLGTDPPPMWFMGRFGNDVVLTADACEIQTLEGVMRADAGDYIIKGVKGELYPCKDDIFEATYEAAE